MQEDFHYYATYCAAYLAGYSHDECLDICYSAQFVDCCSRTFLTKIKAPLKAATTQLQLEMMDARTDIVGLQDITRIWASFHFLPGNLYAFKKGRNKRYMNKYRLICEPDSNLVERTVELARGKSLQHIGISMHVMADTWAHRHFAGTPSLVINNTDDYFYELDPNNGDAEIKIAFRHNPTAPDDLDKHLYTNSLYQSNENSVMNLGHGRAGHLPDYSFIKYKYLPAWGEYEEVIKDNPSDYTKAFCQMIYALKYLRGVNDTFEVKRYDEEAIKPWEDKIDAILRKRQLIASEDWKAFGEELSGCSIKDFNMNEYNDEYMSAAAGDKDATVLGKFIKGAIEQKGMVTNQIFKSGNILAGFSKEMFLGGGAK